MKFVETLSSRHGAEVRLFAKIERLWQFLMITQRSVMMFSARIVSDSLSLAVTALLLTCLPNVAIAADAPASAYEQTLINKSASGEELVSAFLTLASRTGSPSGTVGTTAEQDEASRALVKPYLDPAFQLQRASGQRYTAENVLPADLDEFEVGDLRETRPAEDLVVVRYSVRASQTLPDAALVMSKDKAPRLTVFHWSASDSRWKVLSHANFNTPVAAICDRNPLIDNGLESSASAEDQKLGISLIEKYYSLLEKADSRTMVNPQAQGQGATGVGYTTLAEYKEPKLSKVQLDDFVVTRNKDLIVVSLYARSIYRITQESGVISNVTTPSLPLTEEVKPRLFTFLQSEAEGWRLIATAVFNPPKALPQGTVCVPSGSLEQAP